MEFLQTVLVFLVTLGILVVVHEFGHFWVARRAGVQVLRFCVGMGKPIWSHTAKDGVEYSVAPFPIGGYVKMLGEGDESYTPEMSDRAFDKKSVWWRIAIAAAGPVANFILAIFAFYLMLVSGIAVLAPVVGEVSPDSAAQKAGLTVGDELIAVDGRDTRSWEDVSLVLIGRLGDTGELLLTVKTPGGQTKQLAVPINSWLRGADEVDVLGGLGLRPMMPAVPAILDNIQNNSAAKSAGLVAGDEIIGINGQEITTWAEFVEQVQSQPQQRLTLSVLRGEQAIAVFLTPGRKQLEDGRVVGFAGTGVKPPKQVRQQQYGLLEALPHAWDKTWQMTTMTLASIKKMIVGDISQKNLSGPITIAKVAGDSAELGLERYLYILGLLSISLGVLNLLPIPLLDGGQILFCVIEAVIRRPVPERIQAVGMQFGLLLVGSLMMLAIYNDIARF